MKQEANPKIKSGYDKWKRIVLRRCLDIASDAADSHIVLLRHSPFKIE